MIRILFFAKLREALGNGESFEWSPTIATTGALRDVLVARGDKWETLKTVRNLRVAVNHTMVGFDAPLHDGDEVAFFPPVTGG